MKKTLTIIASVVFVLSLLVGSSMAAGEYKSEGADAADLSREEALDLEGAPVMSNTGKLVGSNEQIIFNQAGEPNYLLLSVPEQAGVIPIPIEKVRVLEGNIDSSYLSVGYDEEKIMKAPSFDSLEDFTMPGTRVKVRSYFDME